MVEHTSAQTTQHHRREQQSSNVARPARTATNNSANGSATSASRFSLFSWFKRRDSTSSADNHRRRPLFRKVKRRPSTSSSSSSASSVDSFYSTATVRSFAFLSGVRRNRPPGGHRVHSIEPTGNAVGPFAPGAVKLVDERQRVNTCTLPSAFSQRQDIRTRYFLRPVDSPFISYDNIPVVDRRPRGFAEVRKHPNRNSITVVLDTLTSDSSLPTTPKKVHVKGKRRAPEPPPIPQPNGGPRPASGGRRKRRPAPKPPGYANQDTLSSGTSTGMDTLLVPRDSQTISNDTLVLRRGVLLSKKDANSSSSSGSRTPVGDPDNNATLVIHEASSPKQSALVPRPWYKRDHSNASSRDSSLNTRKQRGGGDFLRVIPPTQHVDESPACSAPTSPLMTTSFPFEGSLSRLSFFHRSDDKQKKEKKRKSGVSILTNISELDKEAAAIVQEEQARNRASMLLQAAKMDEDFERRMAANEQIVQDIVNASMENHSPRRSARALISKFNALGNITRVTVNSNIFNKSSPRLKNKRFSQDLNRGRRELFIDEKLDRDLAKILYPRRVSPKRDSGAIFTEVIIPCKPPVKMSNPRIENNSNNDVEFTKTLVAELDDVASGIARLRRELDERPKMIEKAVKRQEIGVNKLSPERTQELAKFDKEFNKIFDEIDKQLRPKEPTPPKSASKASTGESSIASQVAKVLDILAAAEKEARSVSTRAVEEPRPRVQRISGVDDKTTNELKEMLKEMKHSLPKPPEDAKPSNRPSTSSSSSCRDEPNVSSTKVSSAVQTSGNVRRVINETNEEARQPRSCKPENTYANAIERSAVAKEESETKGKIDLRDGASARSSPTKQRLAKNLSFESDKGGDNAGGEKLEDIKKQCMNTLAVNRLLRKLEAAIASGHHQQAAILAKELAQLKIHCSVVRQRSCSAKERVNLNMYIEDKQAHQGPIPLQLPVSMTVAQLKAKIHIEFEIPANVQRWIIGKNLPDNDESSLEELQAVEGSSVFLYIVTPPDLQDKGAIKRVKQQQQQGEDEKDEVHKENKAEVVAAENAVINEKNEQRIHHAEIKTEIKPLQQQQIQPEAKLEEAAVVIVEDKAAAAQQNFETNRETLSTERKLRRYEELMSLENCDAIPNSEPIECPVCFMIAHVGEGVILRDCLHSFCRSCVANTVRYCEEAEVKCPYRDTDYTCESTLQEREIKALVTAEVYQQHLAKSIAQAENNAGNNAFHCKTPDCPGWCIYDDDVNNFLCPVCKVNNCLTCQAIHMGKNCRQYQEELKYSKEGDHESRRTAAMLEEMVDRGEALPCPTCAVVLMKKWGCDWLRCSMCKTEICWVTRGPRWGPGGKGDTSGGCKCGENGVKCHPRCNYCH